MHRENALKLHGQEKHPRDASTLRSSRKRDSHAPQHDKFENVFEEIGFPLAVKIKLYHYQGLAPDEDQAGPWESTP